ncbi:MAG: flagellar basal body-associated FliL family protein [Desulfovibrio sp.]|nr:flagellar basal body-associated FliL family protein [Desulfovibrio sp.]
MSQTSGEGTKTKDATVAPEVEVASQNVPAANPETDKVQLDLEDAPFLKEEPEEQEKQQEEAQESAPAVPEKKPKKKKFVIIALAAILITAGVVGFIFFGSPAPPPPPPPPKPKPDVIVVPSKPDAKSSPDIVMEFERFIIPVGNSLSSTNFLICKFSTVSKSPTINSEIEQKMLVLRDAVYFYLRGKSYEYLLNPDNATAIKSDLVGILNDYLGHGKLEDVLLDSYLGH